MKIKRKAFFLFILLILICIHGNAQSVTIDSLKNLLSSKTGVIRVDILNSLAHAYKNDSSLDRLNFIEEAIKLSSSLNYESGLQLSLYNYAKYFSDKEDYSRSIVILKNIANKFSHKKEDINIGNTYFLLAESYDRLGITDSVQYFLEKSLEIKKALKDSLGISIVLTNIGLQLWGRGKFNESLKYFELALDIRTKINNKELVAGSLNAIGSVYFKIGNYLKAMEYFQKSYPIREETKDEIGKIITWNNIGTIYQKLEYYEKAEYYFKKGLDKAIEHNYKFGIAYSYHNYGILYLEKNELDKSLSYFLKSYEFAKSILNQNLRTMVLRYIGLIYEKEQNYNKAVQYYYQALSIAHKSFDKYSEALLNQGLARINLEKNKYDAALSYIDKSQDFAGKENLKELLRDNYLLYYNYYTKTNNKLRSLEYYKLYSDMKDSLFNFNIGNNLGNMIMKFELSKTESEKKLLENEKQLAENEVAYNISVRNYLIAIIGLAILLGIGLFYLLKYKVKTSKKIEEQKKDLEILNQQLNLQNQKLKELNKAKDKLFSIIAHDLRSPFHSLLAFSQILVSEIETLTQDEIKQCSQNIYDSGIKMFNLVQNLLDWARNQLEKIEVNPTEFLINEIVSEVITIYNKIACAKQIELIDKTKDLFKVYADKNMIDSVIRNLVSNAIKFSNRGSQIEIEAMEENDKVEVKIKDYGVGIEPQTLNNLFQLGENQSSVGTEKETGTGLGLLICKEFIEKNLGEMKVESKPGLGSTFIFSIPKVIYN